MKSLTPDKTIQRLGWKAARKSLEEARSIIAPRPPHLSWYMARRNPLTILRWLKEWLGWPWRNVQFWIEIWKHSRRPIVKEYKALAETGMTSREIFRKTKVRMCLTEDEIFEQGNRILMGENLPPLKHTKEIGL